MSNGDAACSPRELAKLNFYFYAAIPDPADERCVGGAIGVGAVRWTTAELGKHFNNDVLEPDILKQRVTNELPVLSPAYLIWPLAAYRAG